MVLSPKRAHISHIFLSHSPGLHYFILYITQLQAQSKARFYLHWHLKETFALWQMVSRMMPTSYLTHWKCDYLQLSRWVSAGSRYPLWLMHFLAKVCNVSSILAYVSQSTFFNGLFNYSIIWNGLAQHLHARKRPTFTSPVFDLKFLCFLWAWLFVSIQTYITMTSCPHYLICSDSAWQHISKGTCLYQTKIIYSSFTTLQNFSTTQVKIILIQLL